MRGQSATRPWHGWSVILLFVLVTDSVLRKLVEAQDLAAEKKTKLWCLQSVADVDVGEAVSIEKPGSKARVVDWRQVLLDDRVESVQVSVSVSGPARGLRC
ncbi:unnamed protein product [Symbiodinium sp. CCMP2592]|nr:unnamed protein product [Symbiodinium sp. CCMP2592]